MIVRTAACSVDWQDRQAVEDGTLVARDLAQKHEPVSLLSDESRDQVFKGWPLALGLVHEQSDQRTQQLEALARLLADYSEDGFCAMIR